MTKQFFKTLIFLTTIICLLSIMLATPVSAQRQVEELPSPGITPDSFWYFGEILKERLTLIFTFDKPEKLNKYLVFADERLAEAREMTERDRARETLAALDEYISLMKRAEATVKVISKDQLANVAIKSRTQLANQLYYLNDSARNTNDKLVEPKLEEASVWNNNVSKIIPIPTRDN